MKFGLLLLMNIIFRKNLHALYGDGSYVEIDNILFSTHQKMYVISCKLFMSDTNLFEEVGEIGLNCLFEEAWICMGFKNEKFMLQISFDLMGN